MGPNKKCSQCESLKSDNTKLREALDIAMPFVEMSMPTIGHLGACGPESGCDGACADAANVAETIGRIRKILSELQHGV